MKKRGEYSKDKKFELKFRADPKLFGTLKNLSEETQTAMAMVIRDLVAKGLDNRDRLQVHKT